MSTNAQSGARAVWRGLLAIVLVSLLVSLLGACVSTPPPVQEMSDARQALEAARDAGAAVAAPQAFRRATALLENAERSLSRRGFRQAKEQALAARRLAIEALQDSLSLHGSR